MDQKAHKKTDNKENLPRSELKALHERLVKENADLDVKIDEYKSRGVSTDLRPQMNALHEYNEMKDLAQVVLGFLADAENVSITELHRRYNLPTN